MRIHMLTCENIMVGSKELMTRSFTGRWSGPMAGQDKSNVDMQRCLGWPKGSDDAILHLRCYESGRCANMTWPARRNSLGRPRQVVCYHAKISRLARRNSLDGPREFVRRWNMDEWTNPSLGKFLNSLTKWLNEFFGKNPCFKIKLKTMVK
jgi:hypothetical protein